MLVHLHCYMWSEHMFSARYQHPSATLPYMSIPIFHVYCWKTYHIGMFACFPINSFTNTVGGKEKTLQRVILSYVIWMHSPNTIYNLMVLQSQLSKCSSLLPQFKIGFLPSIRYRNWGCTAWNFVKFQW